MVDVAPSVLAAHPLFVDRDVRRLVEAGATTLHLDIMDGHFVPNISFGPAMVKALRQAYPELLLDVHLMLSRPGDFIPEFIKAGADEITIHCEVTQQPVHELLAAMKAAGIKAGLSIKPGTEAAFLKPWLSGLDLALVMTVEPGFGGQQLMPEALIKLQQLRSLGFNGLLSVDGGVNRQNCGQVIAAGADRLVMGTAAFRDQNPASLFSGELV